MSTIDLDATGLRTELDGSLVLPGEPGWDEARQAFQPAVDQRPDAVVLAASANDVVATVNAARAAGLRVAAQSTGHNAGPLGALDGTVLLRTSGLTGITVNPDAVTVRVGAGVRWADVTAAAEPHGLAGLVGSSPTVGVVGYSLGGGGSWLGRAHGLAANRIVSADVVTADGALRHIDAAHDPDLFWAIRGGGGSFAVVTALELGLVPVPDLHGGTLFLPLQRTAEVLQAWQKWTASVPDENHLDRPAAAVPAAPGPPGGGTRPVVRRGRAGLAAERGGDGRRARAAARARPVAGHRSPAPPHGAGHDPHGPTGAGTGRRRRVPADRPAARGPGRLPVGRRPGR